MYFSEIKARQEEIAEAHKSTFQWIFDDAGQRGHRWSNFVQWLESGHGIYWISGKAGSGKSTLMNYICEDPRTMKSLEVWSGTTDVLTPTFFFWNPGSAMQKSSIGLLRSLVYQILEALPHLIPMLADSGMSEAPSEPITPANQRLKPILAWTERRLQMTLRRIICQSISSRVCFFVDGLDEFTGSYSALVELIDDLVQNPNVKACVSSRPYRPFEDAFGAFPKLRLQDLTEQDIRTYATDRLSSLPRTRSLVAGHTKWIPDTVGELLGKAEGVFLWVRIAVEDQIEGVKDDDSPEQLFERLQLLPSEMGDLYVHMLNKINKVHRKEAVHYLRLVLPWESNFRSQRSPNPSLLLMAFAVYDKLDDLLRMKPEIDVPDVTAHCDRTAKRIATTCAGFLEIHSDPVAYEQSAKSESDLSESQEFHVHFPVSHEQSAKLESDPFESENFYVRFLHRTTTDFLLEDERGKKFLYVNSTMDIDPYTSYIKAKLAILILFVVSRHQESDENFRFGIKYYTQDIMHSSFLAEEKTGVAQTALMNLVDSTIGKLLQRYKNGDSAIHWCTRWVKTMSSYLDSKGNFGAVEIVPRGNPSSGPTPTRPVDFLGLTAHRGLLLYVQQKLETGHGLSHRHTASYLLCCVIGGNSLPTSDAGSTQHDLRRLEIIATLLKGGADPNTVVFEGTVWVQVLRQINNEFCPHGPLREAWIKVITAFLDNDANVQERIRHNQPVFYCRSVFDKSSPEWRGMFAVASLVSRTGIKPKEFSFRTMIQGSTMSVVEKFLGHGPGLEEIQSTFIAKGAPAYSKRILCVAFGDECPEELYSLSRQQLDNLSEAVNVRQSAKFDSSEAALELNRVIEELYEELKNKSTEPDNFSDDFSDDHEKEKEEEGDYPHDDNDSPDENGSIYYSVPSSPKN